MSNLKEKLANHRFTIVKQPTSDDSDVVEFKTKQRQAQQRAKRREKMQAQRVENKRNTTLASKLEGFKVAA